MKKILFLFIFIFSLFLSPSNTLAASCTVSATTPFTNGSSYVQVQYDASEAGENIGISFHGPLAYQENFTMTLNSNGSASGNSPSLTTEGNYTVKVWLKKNGSLTTDCQTNITISSIQECDPNNDQCPTGCHCVVYNGSQYPAGNYCVQTGASSINQFCTSTTGTTSSGSGSTIDPTAGCGANSINTAIGCIPTDPAAFVTFVLTRGIAIGGGLALLLILYGSFTLITSAGNPENIQKGKETITSAIIGLVFILFSVFILKIIGVDILQLTDIIQST